MTKKQLTLCLAVLGFSTFSWAGPAEEKAALELTKLVLSLEAYNQMLEEMVNGMSAMMPQQAAKKDAFTKAMKEVMPYDEMVKMNSELYAKHFTLAEIKELIAIYKTPVGRKLSRLLPTITGEASRASAKLMPERLPAALKKHGLLDGETAE